MKRTEDVQGLFSYNFDQDYKAEVTAAEMVEEGVPIEQILILMLGSLRRTYRKDVDFLEKKFSELDHHTYTVINTPKEGIYDMLPEGLFHTVSLKNSVKSQKEIVKIIKEHRDEEFNARRFFAPFETSINHLRIQLALYENKLDKRSHYSEFSDIFTGNWEIFNYLDEVQSNLFVHLLPIIHDIRDDYPLAETIIELILMVPVSIVSQRRKPTLIDSPMVSTLGENALGVDFTTGNILFDDGDNTLQINMGPMTKEQLKHFMPGTKQSKVFELLCDHLLPVHIDVATEFELIDEDKICVLADGDDSANSVMGFSTYF